MDRARINKVIRGAQTLMRATGVYVVIDGIWGRKSESAFTSLPTAKQSDVTDYVTQEGVDFSAIRAKAAGPRSGNGTWIPEAQAQAFADEAADYADIPREWMRFILSREANTRVVDGLKELQVDGLSPSKSYKGLFQVGDAAWRDATDLPAFKFIGLFSQNWASPRLNAYAAAGYAVRNMQYVRNTHKFKGEFTPSLIYALHNQGHGFMTLAKKGTKGKYFSNQSKVAQNDLLIAAKDATGKA